MKIRYGRLLLAFVLVCATLAGCAPSGSTPPVHEDKPGATDATDDLPSAPDTTTQSSSAPDNLPASGAELTRVTDDDLNAAWDDSASVIALKGTTAQIAGGGAETEGGVVYITEAGDYAISGTLEDGFIAVDVSKDDRVRLILDNAHITNKTGAPLFALSCDKMIITLAEGTHNTLTDGGADFRYADEQEEEPNAALFCKDDLTINGAGALSVHAGFNNGIGSKDDLLIVGGSITVEAANHGLRGNDSVRVRGGDITVAAGNDGIQTNNNDDAELGWVLVEGGALTIASAHDGIQADTSIMVTGGALEITTGADVPDNAASDSFKALKADGDITVTGGILRINSVDDAIHAGGDVDIGGGELSIATGDDGIHADGMVYIRAGHIDITESYEGVEGSDVYISGGSINIVSSDDAINAAGGADQSGSGGRFGKDRFAAGGDHAIRISGGSVSIAAGGDGIDSNGDAEFSGGTVIVLIRSTPDNLAIDCDGRVLFSGGTVIYGGTGVGAVPDGASSQSYVYVSGGVSAGAEMSLRRDGAVLAAFTPAIDCPHLVFTLPGIAQGEVLEVYAGDTLLASPTVGEGEGMPGRRRWGG